MGNEERRIKVQVIVPDLRNSDRRPHKPRIRKMLRREMHDLGEGGPTIETVEKLSGTDRKGVVDRSHLYTIVVRESLVAKVLDRAAVWCRWLDQEELLNFIEWATEPVFVKPVPAELEDEQEQ